MKSVALPIFLVLGCLFLLPTSFGALFRFPILVDPDRPHECWLKQSLSQSIYLKPGEKYNIPGNCEEYECHKDLSIMGRSCGVISVDDINCRVESLDKSFPYPDCCPKMICGGGLRN